MDRGTFTISYQGCIDEAVGIYFYPLNPKVAYVNVQHPNSCAGEHPPRDA